MNLFTPGVIIPIGAGGPITFQWNPEQLDGPTADANWVGINVAGRELPYYDYGSGGDSVIAFALVFSRYDRGEGYVRRMIDQLVSLTKPSLGIGKKHPPPCIVRLGVRRWTCVCQRVNPSTFDQANPRSLDPYDGKVDLTFLRIS